MIAFDCGIVLTDHGDAMARLAALVGVPEGAFATKFWENRYPYDAGEDDLAFWSRVCAAFGKECDAELAARLVDIDLGAWATIRPATEDMLRRLSDRGERMVMLSNAPASFRGHLEAAGWTDVFETLVISGEIGAVKPEAGMYEAVEAIAGDEQIRFVDDRQPNIDVALERGWDAHLWVDDADTAAWVGL